MRASLVLIAVLSFACSKEAPDADMVQAPTAEAPLDASLAVDATGTATDATVAGAGADAVSPTTDATPT